MMVDHADYQSSLVYRFIAECGEIIEIIARGLVLGVHSFRWGRRIY